MNYIDNKYLNAIAIRLQNFKKRGESLWNFRCPYCGDSKKDQSKSRGYIFRVEQSLVFKCHNCGKGASLANLIKHIDPVVHGEYVAERFLNGSKRVEKPTTLPVSKKPIRHTNKVLANLKSVSQLDPDHHARRYIEERKIPTKNHYRLFHVPKFKKFVNGLIPDKFGKIIHDEERLLIPLLDADGVMFGFQGRALGIETPKYYTIILNDDRPKIFGMDTVDWRKTVTVVEGPFDSMFLENSIAMAGADLKKLNVDAKLVFCYDNEPRNPDIVRHMERVVDEGHSIVVFPPSVTEKDINEMVLAGRDPSAIIASNTHDGLMAKTKIGEWKKICKNHTTA